MKKLKYIISGFQEPYKGWDTYGITHEMKLLFVNYMLKESNWKGCFLNPDAEDVINNHWLLDINTPTNLLVNGAFATRLISEFPRKFRAWVEFVNGGMDKNEAFFICHWVQGAEKENPYPFKVVAPGGHIAIADTFGKTYFDNFIKNKPVNLSEQTYAEELSYGSVNTVWGIDRGVNHYEFEHLAPRVKVVEDTLDIFFNPSKENKQAGWKFNTKEELFNLYEDIKSIILKG